MVNASTSLLSSFSDETTARRTEIFLWSVMAVAILDLILLLSTFQPWAKPDNHARLTPVVEETVALSSGDKPSAFGAVAPRVNRVAAKAQAK